MFLRRAAPALSKRTGAFRPAVVARRGFAGSVRRFEERPREGNPKPGEKDKLLTPLSEIKDEHDLMPPGAAPGTIPTDLEQATGLERLEILGKMQGVDVFDMRPLDASRVGTLEDPIVVRSFGDEQYVGCTGCPADSHNVIWLTCSRDRPIERCPECGSAYQMEYVGPQDDGHGHGHGHDIHDSGDGAHNYEGEPKTMADFVKPEYR
ncbi:Cytochrome c oxidase subunit 4, mitochondrial [Salinomyces thailandicus]|uniref:Cytochrome c oxidase subunit 4, mitochondrial n=1 Tax=Salinomyces thailandicus TaxID=706561 RepID=A0A4U0TTA1_9PEZI|nr:Cytochrome c oxidase subunit 4, mitochondrial [Salinomyces thailandica]